MRPFQTDPVIAIKTNEKSVLLKIADIYNNHLDHIIDMK